MNPVSSEPTNTNNIINKHANYKNNMITNKSIINNNNNNNINNTSSNNSGVNGLYTEEELKILDKNKNENTDIEMSNTTDEENWQEVEITSKKRKSSTELVNELRKKSNQTINNENRFAILNQTDESPTENNTVPKPPPIFLPGIKNIVAMANEVKRIVANDFTYKCLRDNQVKIMVKTIPSYRTLIKHFDLKKKNYFTYQVKQERAYRVVLKNLHYSTPKEDIKNELLTHGHDTRNISNVYSKKDKSPLPIFFVDLEPKENNKEIYNITLLNNAVVKFEPPLKTHDLVQCHRCQEYGHTKNYCKKPFRCVKCGLGHPTAECKRMKDSPPQCVHCLKDHTASYKGCQIYQELISKNNYGRTRTVNINNNSRINFENSYSNRGHMSYADVTRGQTDDAAFLNNNNNNNNSSNNSNNINCDNNNFNNNTSNSSTDNLLLRLEKMINNQNEQITNLLSMMTTLMSTLMSTKLCK